MEPSGFLKISAAGGGGTRVWVIIDLVDPVSERATLGDGYRVESEIVVWRIAGVVAALMIGRCSGMTGHGART